VQDLTTRTGLTSLTRTTVVFTVLFAVFVVGPALLRAPFPPYDLMHTGDVLDLFTPVVLLPLYWLMFRVRPGAGRSTAETLAFVVLAALWAEGQGMHLAANAIGHLSGHTSASGRLTHTYDEVVGHYLWHIGLVGLSALLVWRQHRHPFPDATQVLVPALVAGAVHGFTYFLVVTEGATAPLGVPFAVLAAVVLVSNGRTALRQPLGAFSLAAYVVACGCFAAWALYWGGLPEFSEVGLLD